MDGGGVEGASCAGVGVGVGVAPGLGLEGSGKVVEDTVQLYVFCPFMSTLSARGSTPDMAGAHLKVGLR